MNGLFNRRVLYFIPIVFIIVIIFRISYAYTEVKQREHDFALKQAEVLNTYSMVHRTYYQQFFIDKRIPLNEETLLALPAASSNPISKIFSEDNDFHISIQTVSDRARNYKNEADVEELKAIEFFKENIDKDIYFSAEHKEFYQFAHALRIEQKCLKCHGEKSTAPDFIRAKYKEAYNYKLGDVRGVQSIKLPKSVLNKYFMKDFLNSIVYDLTLLIALFIGIFILLKKSNKINTYLQDRIDEQTTKLKNSLVIDSLTLLPNRLQLMEDIKKAKKQKTRYLALLNVNNFKDINDFYGHETGDLILKEIAKLLNALCKDTDNFIYKLPSDEFALFSIKKISEKEFHKKIKETLKELHNSPIKTNEHSLYITLSVGIASNNEALLTYADIALKSAKYSVNEIVVYDETINNSDNILKNMKGIMLIKESIQNDNVVPFFQPIYNVRTRKIEKFESLIRIVQDDGTIIPPFKFLDIAMKSKLYPKLTKIMIQKAFEFFIDKDYDFSINLSIDDVANAKTTKFIIEELKKYPNPHRVVFEILESDEINDYEHLKEFIIQIKQFGCKFSLDDFGSGYSNFSHVLELNIDYLKIDASLVKYITTNENSKVITKTIIDFAATLGMKTIAEYVEDEESLELLNTMGVDFVQGYYIGKPEKNLKTNFQ